MNRKDLTQGGILGNIMTFSLPYVLTSFLQILYGLADLFVIGQYCSVDSTTAVSNGSQVMYLLTCVVIGLAKGNTVRLFTDDVHVVGLGAEYLRGYVWDCIFVGIHFCFSGFFTACGYSIISFAHNFISIICARVPLVYLASERYSDFLFPMGLATCFGSILSCIVCIVAYQWVRKRVAMPE